MIIKRNITETERKQYSSIVLNTEWMKEGTKKGEQLFHFTVLYFQDIPLEEIQNCTYPIHFVSAYIENKDEIKTLIELLNELIDPDIYDLLIGHQLTTQLHRLSLYSEEYDEIDTSNFDCWISFLGKRKENTRIFDTYFDIQEYLNKNTKSLILIGNEMKLMSLPYNQEPEIKKSITAMQKEFEETKKEEIREKLSILNLRHSILILFIYQLYKQNIKLSKRINVNRVLFYNLQSDFSYVTTAEFKDLMKLRYPKKEKKK